MRALLVALVTLWCALAHAHAPLPEGLAVGGDGALAISLPGFGLAVRARADARFVYACDALLDLPTSNDPPAMYWRSDGTLLLGSPYGLRGMARDGCPVALPASSLASKYVYKIAGTREVLYALAEDGMYRSMDEGSSWELRTPLAGAAQFNALVVDAKDPERLYASRGKQISVFESGAALSTGFLQERELTMVYASDALWAVARTEGAVGNTGFELLRAELAVGPWTRILRIDYFGGFAVDATGAIWLADEGSVLYRSSDGGDTFQNVARIYPSHLLADGDGVLATTEDLPTVPGLFRVSDQPSPVVSFADITEMASCPNVAQLCALAWAEWDRDVLVRESPDAGVLVDASVDASHDAGGAGVDASAPSMVMVDAGSTRPSSGGGCALSAHGGGAWSSLALALLALRRHKLQRA